MTVRGLTSGVDDNESQQKSLLEVFLDEIQAGMHGATPVFGGYCTHDRANMPSSECNTFFASNFDISIHMLKSTADLERQFCPDASCTLSAAHTATAYSARSIREHFIRFHANVSDLEKDILREFCDDELAGPTQVSTSYQPAPAAGIYDWAVDPTLTNDSSFQEAPPQNLPYQTGNPVHTAAAANQFAAPQSTFAQAVNPASTNGLDAIEAAVVLNLLPYNQDQAAPPMAATQPLPQHPAVGGAPQQRGRRTSRTTGTGKHSCNWEGCTSTFTTEQSRQNHVKSRHLDQQLPCPEPRCNKVFNDASNLRRHMQVGHKEARKRGGKEMFPCEICGKESNRRDNLVRHLGRGRCAKALAAKRAKEAQEAQGMQQEQQE